ncbi:phage/plasmid primase, P4 family [Legionella longbeachae]|uniref:phage/plasmid primase, P4 family n=1 Tax=Legionella longbeachae TaxID=450 RepID=UPI001A937C28|nr:phage/plasmid primase, P4 family [Legionella longbeachae]UAK47256.1 DUF5906 domain-containing protein [Legionella longbeachae]
MFHDFLASNGHPLDGNINFASEFHRYRCPHGGSKDAVYKIFTNGVAAGYFKCWHCGIEDDFCSKSKHDISVAEWEAHNKRLKEAKRQEDLNTRKRYAECAQLARKVFSSAIGVDATKEGYLSKKRVQSYGLKLIDKENEYTKNAQCYSGTLLVPCYNAANELVNLERIYFDVSQSRYQKRPLAGAQRSGAFYILGDITAQTRTVLIAEGYSTAATLYEALGYPTVITFNCGNILPVAKVLREKYPYPHFLIAADDDRWHEDEKLKYSGEKVAKKTCAEVNNTTYVLPDFSVLDMPEGKLTKLKPTDFNDLFVLLMDKGASKEDVLAEIKRQIFPTPTPHAEVLGRLLKKIPSIDFREHISLNENETLKNNHYQITVIDSLLDIAMANNWGICKSLDFIYLFNGAFWSQLDESEFKLFLGSVAEKMGVDRYRARYFNFRDHLYKQFLAVAQLPRPEVDNGNICINLMNGTFEFSQGGFRLREFDRNDFLTYQLPFEYQPDAEAPLFHQYLNEVLPDKKLQDVLAEYLGSIFISSITLKLEKTLVLYGTGANGKSVFYEIVKSLLGEENTSAYSMQSLTDNNGYYRAMIANKLVNYSSEINGKLEASFFKQLVSNEPVEARMPYGRPFTLKKYAKLIFNCNELPKDVEQTEAYFRRFLIVPFEVTIAEANQDKRLAQKIIATELAGVFNWVLEGMKRLLCQGNFTESDTIRKIRDQYALDSDSVKTFLYENNYKSSPNNFIQYKTLYEEYRMFCDDDGFKPVSKTNFRKRLEAAKVTIERRNFGIVAFLAKETYKDFG